MSNNQSLTFDCLSIIREFCDNKSMGKLTYTCKKMLKYPYKNIEADLYISYINEDIIIKIEEIISKYAKIYNIISYKRYRMYIFDHYDIRIYGDMLIDDDRKNIFKLLKDSLYYNISLYEKEIQYSDRKIIFSDTSFCIFDYCYKNFKNIHKVDKFIKKKYDQN
jgi:hypothetical protein